MKNFEQFLEATARTPKETMSAAKGVASSDKMAQKLTQIQQRRQNERIRQGKISAPAQTRAGKALPADKGSAIVRTKRGGTGKEAVGANKKSGPGVMKGGPLAKYDKGGELARRTVKKDPPKTGPSSDLAAHQRKKINDNKYGKLAKDSLKVGGKAAKGALGLADKALKRASKVKMANTDIESGGDAGSYETKDTKI